MSIIVSSQLLHFTMLDMMYDLPEYLSLSVALPAASQAVTVVDNSPLGQRAARLYPDNAYLQAEWIRAVTTVRSTNGGWVLDAGSKSPGWRAIC